MSGMSQSELDALCFHPENDYEITSASEDGCELDTQLVQVKKKRGRQSVAVAKECLSQEELDAFSCSADPDIECQASDVDEELDTKLAARKKQNNRRVTFSAVSSELAAISKGEEKQRNGLAQSSLDDLLVTEDSYGDTRDLSPLDSALRSSKRKRISVSNGIVGAMARAAELIGSPSDRCDNQEVMAESSPKVHSGKQLGALVSSPRCKGTQDVENAGPENKEQGKDLILEPHQPTSQLASPRRRTLQGVRSAPLCPVKLN